MKNHLQSWIERQERYREQNKKYLCIELRTGSVLPISIPRALSSLNLFSQFSELIRWHKLLPLDLDIVQMLGIFCDSISSPKNVGKLKKRGKK
jgi:hypothetical protein